MKVVAFIVSAMLGITGAAHADEYTGPLPPPAAAQQMQRPRAALREALLERFDANHDGRLEPNERRHAARALRRLARRLMKQERAGRAEQRAERRAVRGAIRRYDLNGDGSVDAGEMAPDMANRLRPLDRNRDGWVDERDLDR